MGKDTRRKGRSVRDRKGRLVGTTRSGQPICIINGRVVIGKGCFEHSWDDDKGLIFEYQRNKCSLEVRKVIEPMLKRAVASGKGVTLRGLPQDMLDEIDAAAKTK